MKLLISTTIMSIVSVGSAYLMVNAGIHPAYIAATTTSIGFVTGLIVGG